MKEPLIFLYLIVTYLGELHAVNHWIVTQSGKIQAFLRSPFDLRKPDDLLALLDQENRKNDISELYEDLVSRKTAIEKKWCDIEENSNIGSRVNFEDADCLAAEKLFSELDLYNNMAINGTERGIRISIPKDIKLDEERSSDKLTEPICVKLTPSKWSEPILNRTNLVIEPEDALIRNFIPMKTLDEFGYFVVKALKENSTSWIHYNLASFYWRVKGKSQEAIDCLKLAIQFGQGIYQDIPLHNLAGILHHSRHPLEAIQLMNSAIKLAPNVPIHYFALGNIYASMTDFNNSIKNYDKCLELDPQNKEVANNRHAMLCYYKLENALTSFQNDLQNILSELHDYHSILQQWLRLQERLMWETATFNYEFDSMNPDMSHVSKKVQRCIKKTTGNKPIISCEFYDKTPEVEKLNLHSLFEIVENERQRLEQFNLETTKINIEPSKLGLPRFPTSMPTKANKYFDATGWPKKDECVEWALVLEDKDDLELPVFIPPDNKGYKLKKAITDDIGLPDYSQHDLPWYPPICEGENVNGEKFIPISEKNLLDVKYKSNAYLKSLFLKYLNDGNSDENEIGQRIITAMKKITASRTFKEFTPNPIQ
ncbi:tetratricopeptide repeat protein 17-like isoform X2 [Anthonomus grandis grandis]|uniref:tetratricopeptide repeat protein 17-like isoform X2 n=1 Tax=Anthonomus grandis grandis TaxID=2921223 RepID=UPI00216556AB|nr:tetratricopeptide repeat protein 17-like isoform X2 [Anthonomus grandis grandis]